MNKLSEIAYSIKHKRVFKNLPWNFLKHYIFPLTIRQKKMRYNPQTFFESLYRSTVKNEFSDRITISPSTSLLCARYHYNAVENSIIRYFASRQNSLESPHVLDVGSGAGHWIDFYIDVFRAAEVCGVDISETCVNALRNKYANNRNVRVETNDVSSPQFKLNKKWDIINAIGSIFHIVDDALWEQTLVNFVKYLNDNGTIVIGGEFGFLTQNVQFHCTDEFASWKERKNASNTEWVYVNKRIRSLRFWKRIAKKVGLQVNAKVRTINKMGQDNIENNLLILSHRV